MTSSYSNRIVVVDCGGDTCKVGFAGQARPLKVVPNVALRPKRETQTYMADQIEQLQDMSQLYYKRPHEKGYVTNWELENQILGRIFGKSMLDVRDKEATLLITEPLFNPAPLRKQMDESIFERHGFEAYHRIPAPSLALFGFQNEPGQGKFGQPCAMVLDTGYSFTHAVPFFNNQPIFAAIKRLNVGGKVLTNYLKETISYRVWNMMDETHLMNDIKHKLCYVSTDFMSDMRELERHRKGKLTQQMTTEYVLPNGTTRFAGFVRTPETKLEADDQTLTLCNERITIPEILFHPSDIGQEQCGIAELIVQSINRCPKHMHSLLYENVLVVGGNACFTGFRQRLEKDLRELAPSEYKVSVAISQDPILTAWQGGSRLATDISFPSVCVTRQQYEEHGVGVCLRKFGQI